MAGLRTRALTGVVLAFATVTPAAAADPIDLRSQAAVQADGGASGDEFGASAAGVGDFNGDGRPDAVVGAPFASPPSQQPGWRAGEVYVLLGRAGGARQVDLRTPDRSAIRIEGAYVDGSFGASVAGAGDVNGDGLADVVVGAPTAGDCGGSGAGRVYVIYGRRSSATIDVTYGNFGGFELDARCGGPRG